MTIALLQIKAAVRERDGNRCVGCGMTNQDHLQKYGRQLHVHRIVPGSEYSLEPGVCETRCYPCHGPLPRRRRHSRPYVRVDAETAHKLRVIAAIERCSVSDLASPVLRPFVEPRYAEALRKAAEKQGKGDE